MALRYNIDCFFAFDGLQESRYRCGYKEESQEIKEIKKMKVSGHQSKRGRMPWSKR